MCNGSNYYKEMIMPINEKLWYDENPFDLCSEAANKKLYEFSAKLHKAWCIKNWNEITNILIEMEEFKFNFKDDDSI